MHYLGLALFPEGPTDHEFFHPLLRRVVEEVCLRNARSQVEVGMVYGLTSPEGSKGSSREQRILGAAQEARGAFDVLFVHADGAGKPEEVRAQQVDPARQLVEASLGSCVVGLVPVREMEAWTLVDGDAVRAAFGTKLDDDSLGLPKAAAVEFLLDPKQALEEVYQAVVGKRRSKRSRGAASHLAQLGAAVRLEALRQLSAYRRLEEELSDLLRGKGIFE